MFIHLPFLYLSTSRNCFFEPRHSAKIPLLTRVLSLSPQLFGLSAELCLIQGKVINELNPCIILKNIKYNSQSLYNFFLIEVDKLPFNLISDSTQPNPSESLYQPYYPILYDWKTCSECSKSNLPHLALQNIN